MKKVILDKKAYNSHKDFYRDIYEKMDGESFGDFDHFNSPLNNSADILNEFLWYCDAAYEKNIFILKNFNLEKIKNYKNFDDYKFNLIINSLERFVKEYPNNTLEFVNDEEK